MTVSSTQSERIPDSNAIGLPEEKQPIPDDPEFIKDLFRRLKTRIPLDFTSNNSVT